MKQLEMELENCDSLKIFGDLKENSGDRFVVVDDGLVFFCAFSVLVYMTSSSHHLRNIHILCINEPWFCFSILEQFPRSSKP